MSLKKIVLFLGDIAVSVAAIAAALFTRHGGNPDPVIIELYRFAAPFLIGLWIIGFIIFGLYDLKTARNEPRFFERLWRALAFNLAVTAFLFYLIPEFRLKPMVTLVVIFATLGALLSLWRGFYNAMLARLGKERVLFLGLGSEMSETARFLLDNPQLGFTPVGFAAAENGDTAGLPLPVFGSIENLAGIIAEERISIVIIAHDLKKTRSLARSLFAAVPLGATIVEFPRFYETVEGKVPVSLISEAWFLENLIGMKRPKYEFAKRILDLVLALTISVAAALLFPFIAAAIILSTPRDILHYRTLRAHTGDGVIFFRQKRIGKNGAPFAFIKFRSQRLGAEKMGWEKSDPKRASSSGFSPDPRSYPFGNFLRKTYLDELPQVWNIIKGEMSFAGPRPERPEFVRQLEGEIPFYRVRELVLPGITGWAQINMKNDASVSDAPEKLQYDLYYIKNRSLFLDLNILLKTALKLLQRSGR